MAEFKTRQLMLFECVGFGCPQHSGWRRAFRPRVTHAAPTCIVNTVLSFVTDWWSKNTDRDGESRKLMFGEEGSISVLPCMPRSEKPSNTLLCSLVLQ